MRTKLEQQAFAAVEFVLPGPGKPVKSTVICPYALAFANVCEKLVEETKVNLSDIRVNLALLTLQEKFFSCFELAPKACRKHMFSDKVVCLMTSYRESFMQLHQLRLQITPIRLREEPLPVAPITQVYRLDSFPLGEFVTGKQGEES